MDKRVFWIFLSVSLAFFLFIVGLTGYRIETARTRNAAAVRERLPAIAGRVAPYAQTPGPLDSPFARRTLRAVFDGEPRLLLMSIHSPADGILYIVGRNRSYLEQPAVLSSAWHGTPVYRVSRGYELALSQQIGADPAARTLDCVFVIMGREDLYPVIRDDLYLFLAFLLVTGVLMLIVMSVQADIPPGVPRGGPSGGSSRPSPGGPREDPQPPAAGSDDGGTSLTSPRTGLVWAEHMGTRLDAELERAASSDQDLSFARIRIDEPFADSHLPIVYGEIARILRSSFPLPDCIFESGNDSYSIVLPETDIDAAVKSLDAFRQKVASAPIAGRKRQVSIGVTSRGGRLLERSDLVEEADISVAKALREGGNQVVGFRADPARFRESLSAAR